MTQVHCHTQRATRHAITLVEVIFSIGVVLIGMVGLLSVLPLAGRRAQDAISLNVASQMSESVFDQLEANRFFGDGLLRKFSGNAIVQTVPGESYVIDPQWTSNFPTGIPSGSTPSFYAEEWFPFYEPRLDPLLDPHREFNASDWPVDQPRMARAGIINPTPPLRFLNSEQSLRLVENADDLPVVRPSDRTKPSSFSALQGTSGGLPYGKRVSDGTFTWFATVNPLPGNEYASVSVVVTRKRDSSESLPSTASAIATETDRAESERIAYVNFASGFSGGAGGTVHLIGSTAVDSSLRSGDWLMLSRRVSGSDIHRWFRVVSVDGKAEVIPANATNPIKNPKNNADTAVWRHRVLLDGPDWSFGFPTPGPSEIVGVGGVMAGALGDNTYATLVSDVVSVTERTIRLRDL